MTDEQTLLADSGSTKTDWALGAHRWHTQGINPIHLSDDAIAAILHHELLPQLASVPQPLAVRFYGSGVRPDQQQRMERLLRGAFPQARTIEAHSDLLGAARALCGHSEGLACILGTGANSCLYDGQRIVQNTPPLGYILGDEGSGAVMGRHFLNAVYKGRLYEGAREEFEQHFQLTLADVIDRVYRQPMANRWLASLAPYVHQHLGRPEASALVVDGFRRFISHNVAPYGRPDLPLAAVGSIAYFFRQQLEQAAAAEGYRLGTVLRSPLG